MLQILFCLFEQFARAGAVGNPAAGPGDQSRLAIVEFRAKPAENVFLETNLLRRDSIVEVMVWPPENKVVMRDDAFDWFAENGNVFKGLGEVLVNAIWEMPLDELKPLAICARQALQLLDFLDGLANSKNGLAFELPLEDRIESASRCLRNVEKNECRARTAPVVLIAPGGVRRRISRK